MKDHYLKSKGMHLNYEIILDIIEPESRVLDLGCGSGALLKLLKDKKNIKGKGIELDENNVIQCIEKGLHSATCKNILPVPFSPTRQSHLT